MTTKSTTKKQPLAAQSFKPEEVEAALIPRFSLVATSTKMLGSITQQSTEQALPNICFPGNLLDVGGIGTTAGNGRSLYRLSHFICPTGGVFHAPVNIVATAFSSTPCFLTVTHTFLNNGADIEITIFAWDAKGAAVPGITFHWRCRVVLLRSAP
jgi:hypothetical protein